MRYEITAIGSGASAKVVRFRKVATRKEANRIARIARGMAQPGSCFGFEAVQIVKLLPTPAPVITWRRQTIGKWQTINHTARAAEGK